MLGGGIEVLILSLCSGAVDLSVPSQSITQGGRKAEGKRQTERWRRREKETDSERQKKERVRVKE